MMEDQSNPILDRAILSFFQRAREALDRWPLDETPSESLSLPECRQLVLKTQEQVLEEIVQIHNAENGDRVTTADVQGQLAKLDCCSQNLDPHFSEEMKKMENAARFALTKLVLWSEIKRTNEDRRGLQSEGSLEESKLLDFFALCSIAVSLPNVKKHLVDGSPLFEEESSVGNASLSKLKFPQARLERIQSLIAKAHGWEPTLVTKELSKMFVDSGIAGTTTDSELGNRFRSLILEMSSAVNEANAEVSHTQLSDIDEGGVTRVVSVECSDIAVGGYSGVDYSNVPVAPRRQVIDPHLPEEEQKHQIRIASAAARLQNDIATELLNMDEDLRRKELEKAQHASEEFERKVLSLPPGEERIIYLQSLEPETSRLLSIHKLWPAIAARATGNG